MEEKNYNSDKKIEIVRGNSKELEISEVKDNLTFEVHKKNTDKEIVIPENQNTSSQSNNSESQDNLNEDDSSQQ